MELWKEIKQDAQKVIDSEPILSPLINTFILNQNSLDESIATILANKFADTIFSFQDYQSIFLRILNNSTNLLFSIESDILAIRNRDPACQCYVVPLLYYKGFIAIQSARISNELWQNQENYLAYHLQHKNAVILGVDIHPNVQIGNGILLDHATSFVAGETAIIGNNVSILHEVTLGGSGKTIGDRHPKIADDVLIGAGAKLLGNIQIGKGSKIGAGSVVLTDVPAHTTVVGIPAKNIGKPYHLNPSQFMDQRFT